MRGRSYLGRNPLGNACAKLGVRAISRRIDPHAREIPLVCRAFSHANSRAHGGRLRKAPHRRPLLLMTYYAIAYFVIINVQEMTIPQIQAAKCCGLPTPLKNRNKTPCDPSLSATITGFGGSMLQRLDRCDFAA